MKLIFLSIIVLLDLLIKSSFKFFDDLILRSFRFRRKAGSQLRRQIFFVGREVSRSFHRFERSFQKCIVIVIAVRAVVVVHKWCQRDQ